jgi:ABC-type nitrate/sulfonate/bicarbonate transport system substrate-binding protein
MPNSRPTFLKASKVLAALGVALFLAGNPISAGAQAPLKKLTVFIGPLAGLDSIWMADAQGYFRSEGLDVDFKQFPSGTTALQTFKTGAGDLVHTGELPAVNYWLASNKEYRVVATEERNSLSYSATVLNDVKTAADLKGKVIVTRVGSTGSWFISEYLAKNGVNPADVTIKDLETSVQPTALCRGDIAAMFIWHPFGLRAREICPTKVHELTTAEGYIHGYSILGARPTWLQDPANQDTLNRFVRAMMKGRVYALAHPEDVVAYMKAKFGADEASTTFMLKIVDRTTGFDKVFYDDFCHLTVWMKQTGLMHEDFDFSKFVYAKGLAAFDPALDALPATTCK